MNHPVPDDALSAFFDEELSPSERDDISRHLSESQTAREELAEIQLLSQEVKSLAGEQSPHDLLSGVMNQIQGTSPSANSAETTEIEPAVAAKSWVSSTSAIFKWVASVVAMALMVVWIPRLWNRSETGNSQPIIAANSRTDENPEQQLQPADPRNLAVESPENPPQPSPVRPPVRLGSEEDLMASNPSDPVVAKNLAIPSKKSRNFPLPKATDRSESNDQPTPEDAKFAEAQVGQIIELAKRQGDEVVVVELTVVDVQKSLGQLQILFASNSIPAANFSLNRSRTVRDKIPPGDSTPDSQLGLYVQTTDHQMNLALKQLRMQFPVSHLEAKTTLAMTSIPVINLDENQRNTQKKPEAETKFAQNLAQSIKSIEARQRRQTKPDNVQIAKDDAVGDLSGKKSQKPGEVSPATGPTAAGSDLANIPLPDSLKEMKRKIVTGTQSFQMVVETPSKTFAANKQSPKEAQPTVAALRLLADKGKQNGFGGAGETKQTTSAPLRFLFVLREQPTK